MKIPPCFKAYCYSKQLAVFLVALVFAACAKKEMSQPDALSVESAPRHAVAATVRPTKAEALLAMQCYNNAFYHLYGTYGPSYKAYYYSDVTHSGRMGFWTQAEAIEPLIDA